MRTNLGAARDFLIFAAVLAILLAPVVFSGCEGLADKIPPITLEACYLDPEYGKVCGAITRDKAGNYAVLIKADVALPPDVRERFDRWAGREIERLEAGDRD